MADAEFSFSTKQVAQQVDSATKSLDLLVQKMKELDKTSLNQMQRELNNLKQNGPEAIKGMVAGMKGSVREMKALLEEGLVAPMKSSRFREAFNGYSTQFKAMTDRVESIQRANTGKMLAEEQTKNAGIAAEQQRASAEQIKDLRLNVKYAADIEKARQQVIANGSSTMLRSLEDRAAKIRRLLESEGAAGEAIARKTYGSDFLAVMKAGLAGQVEALAKHGETTIGLRRAQHEQMIKEGRETQAKLNAGLQADQLKDEVEFQKQLGVARNGLQADQLKDEVEFQKQLGVARNGLQADQLKDEVEFQKQLGVARNGLQADQLKDEVEFQKQARIAARGLQEDMLRDELHYQKQIQDARKKAEAESSAAAMRRLSASNGEVSKSLLQVNSELDKTHPLLRMFSANANDAHSAARGLASGFGALFLTWGALGPLFAGAAFSYGTKAVVKMGAEVDHTMQTIAVLSEESTEAVAGLNEQMLELAKTGPVGPKEIADAMKSLSLAGLSAAEVSVAIKDVMNLAIAGDTSIKDSAETLTSIGAAYKIASTGYNTISDMIAKTAAVSKASVEDMSEAFKASSVVNSLFGVSLKDTAIGLAALSNLGIKASTAGTSLRNMYTDLAGRTPKVEAALSKLGVKLTDNEGKFKDVVTMVTELDKALNKFSAEEQKRQLRVITSERGGKELIALLDLYRAKVAETSGAATDELTKLAARIDERFGFAAISAARMALTPLNEMRSVATTLQTVIIETFDGLQPTISNVSSKLKELFKGEDFKGGLSEIITGVAGLTTALAGNLTLILSLAKGYAAFKLAQLAGSAFIAIAGQVGLASAALKGLSAAFATTAAAQATAAIPAGMSSILGPTVAVGGAAATSSKLVAGLAGTLGTLGRMLPGIGLAVQVGATAWMLYEMFVSKASGSVSKAANSNSYDQLAEKLREETTRLGENTEALLLNMSVEELRATKALGAKGGKVDLTEKQTTAIEALTKAEKELAKARLAKQDLGFSRAGPTGPSVTVAEAAVTAAKSFKETADAEALASRAMVDIALSAHKATAKENADAVLKANREAAETQSKELARIMAESGSSGLKGAGAKNSPGSDEWAENFRINSDNALKEIEKRYNSETELSRKLNTTKQNENKALMEAGLITLGDYQAKELSMAKESEAAQLQGIANVRKAHAEEHQKRITWVEGLKAAWEKANAGKKGFDAKTDATAKTFEAELKRLKEEAETFGQKLDDAEVSLKDAVAGRMKLAAIAVGKPIQELAVEMKKFDDEQGRRSEKQIRDQQLAIDSLTMTPKQIASVKAYNDELEYTNAQTDKMADKLSEIEKSYAAYIEAVSANSVEGPWNPDQLEAAEKYQEQIKKLTDELKKYQEQGGLNATTAGNRASTLFDKSESQKTIKDVASAITDGLFKGGKEGSKKLRETVTDKLKEPINLAINAALNVATNYVQGLLSGGGSSSESGGGSSGGGLGGLISTGNGIWNAFSGSTVGSMASGVAKVGTLLGSSAMTAFGNAALGTSLGLGGASSAAAASAASAAAGGAAAGGAASLGSMAAAAGPWVAGIAAVYTLAKKFDKSGTAHVGGLAQYSATGGLKTSQRHGDFGMGFGGVDYNEGISSMVSGVAQSITGLLDSTALAFGKTAGYTVATAFADDSSRDGAWGGLVISKLGTELLDWADTRSSKWAPKVFADGEAGSKQYLAAISQSVMGVIKGMDLPGWAIGMLDNLGAAPSLEQLATVMDQINQTHAALKVMGETLVGFAGMTDRTTAALIAASGGISNLAANANKYYENFYSEAEKQANASKQVANAMASVNLQMPTTREGYRALVEQYTAMGEAGASTVAVLLGLSGAFASVVPAATGIGNLSEALEKLRNPLRSIEDIANNIISLEDELFALQNEGNTAALRAKELAGLTDTERAIKLQIYALQDQKEALEKVADAAQEAINVQEAYANSMSSAGSGIADLIRELTTTQGGTAGPMQTMRQAQANYLKDLSLARQGDVSASERIAQSAREYIDASGAVSMNSTQAAINAQVVSELKALPATRTYEQKMLDELVKITDLTLQQLSAQNITNTTLANFGTFDINLDGLLTFEELKIALEGKASDAELRAMFQMMDANGDGTISQLELVRNNTAVGAQASQELNAQYIGQSLSLQSQTNASMAEIAASQVKQAFEMSEQRKALDQLLWMATYNYLLGTPHMPMIVTSYMQWVGRTQGNGNGFDQTPMVRFAQGGVFTNSIVDRPTNFSMGQMGEAGPEAIMPLERGSDGSLGVRMYGEGPYATVDFGGMSEALVAMSVQLAKVSAELAEIKRATTATAAHTAGTKDAVQLQNRNGVQVWSDPKEPLQVEAV